MLGGFSPCPSQPGQRHLDIALRRPRQRSIHVGGTEPVVALQPQITQVQVTHHGASRRNVSTAVRAAASRAPPPSARSANGRATPAGSADNAPHRPRLGRCGPALLRWPLPGFGCSDVVPRRSGICAAVVAHNEARFGLSVDLVPAASPGCVRLALGLVFLMAGNSSAIGHVVFSPSSKPPQAVAHHALPLSWKWSRNIA